MPRLINDTHSPLAEALNDLIICKGPRMCLRRHGGLIGAGWNRPKTQLQQALWAVSEWCVRAHWRPTAFTIPRICQVPECLLGTHGTCHESHRRSPILPGGLTPFRGKHGANLILDLFRAPHGVGYFRPEQ